MASQTDNRESSVSPTPLKGRMLRGAISNTVGKTVRVGTSFLLIPFILRHLGETDFGLWALIGSAVGYGTLFDLGIATAIIKYTAEFSARNEIGKSRQLISTALLLYTILGALVVGLSVVLAFHVGDFFEIPADREEVAFWVTVLSGASIGLTIPFSAPGAVLKGLHRFDLTSLLGTIHVLVKAAAIVAALLLGTGLLGVVVAGLAVQILMQVPAIGLVYRVAPDLRFGFARAQSSMIRTVASFSWALFVIHLGGRLQSKTDEIVIAARLPVASVTPFALAVKLAEIPLVISEQFLQLMVPAASELAAVKDWQSLRSLYLTGTRITLAVFFPVGACLIIFGSSILELWAGPGFGSYAPILAVLLVAVMLDASQWTGVLILQGVARHRWLPIGSILTGAANLLLSLALLPRFGLMGVALGTLIPAAVESVFFLLPYTRHVIRVPWSDLLRRTLVPSVLPGIAAVAVLLFMNAVLHPSTIPSVTLSATAGVATYAAIYLALPSNEMERRIALTTFRKFLGRPAREK